MSLRGAGIHLAFKCICRVGERVSSLSPSMPSPDEGPEAQTSMPQAYLTRDVWNLDSDQLQEVLEALQTVMAQREGAAPLLGCPREIQGTWGGGKAITDEGEVHTKRKRG